MAQTFASHKSSSVFADQRTRLPVQSKRQHGRHLRERHEHERDER